MIPTSEHQRKVYESERENYDMHLGYVAVSIQCSNKAERPEPPGVTERTHIFQLTSPRTRIYIEQTPSLRPHESLYWLFCPI
jgi:hypothetical protein